VNDLCDLVDSLSSIICLRVYIFRTEMSPLEAVDGTQIAHFAVGETDVVEELAASLRGRDEVLPSMNQSNSAITARRKTRLVVRRGRTGIGSAFSSFEDGFGLQSENRMGGGAKIESVPVPVRSGRCSPWSRIVRMSFRYWYSS
jgi:hypothetical protein